MTERLFGTANLSSSSLFLSQKETTPRLVKTRFELKLLGKVETCFSTSVTATAVTPVLNYLDAESLVLRMEAP